MSSTEIWTIVSGVAFIAFMLIDKRPHLAEGWIKTIERWAGLAGCLLLAMLAGTSMARFELVGLLAQTSRDDPQKTMRLLLTRLDDISNILLFCFLVAFGLALVCAVLRRFNKEWNAHIFLSRVSRRADKQRKSYSDDSLTQPNKRKQKDGKTSKRPDA